MRMTFTRRPPLASSKPTLVKQTPSASAPASVRIGHVQLRDLILCPAERGVLWYVGDKRIVEQDILSKRPGGQHTLATLIFTPVTIAALRLRCASPSGKDIILLAAGGQDAELYLAAFQYTPKRSFSGKAKASAADHAFDVEGEDDDGGLTGGIPISECTTMIWQHMSSLVGSINNNVLLYLPLPSLDQTIDVDMESVGHETSEVFRPRLVVSNNDCTVKFFDVSLLRNGIRPEHQRPPSSPTQPTLDSRYWRREFGRSREGEGWSDRGDEKIVRFERVGCLRLPVPVNHTSISPDGSTVLACGDASTIYLYRILPDRDGSTLVFEPLANYSIPVPPAPPRPPAAAAIRAMRQRSGSTTVYSEGGGPHSIPDPSVASTYLPFAFVDGNWVLAGSHPYYAGIDGADAPPACFATAWSADGTRFAAAGQEGAVRVWDVRSQNPLEGASWETVPNTPGNTEISSQVRFWYDHPGAAPPWGVRALKFARNASGREVLVFTEHVSNVHVVDADTFSVHDVLRIPHVQVESSSSEFPSDQGAAEPLLYSNPYRRRPSTSDDALEGGPTVPTRPPRFTSFVPRSRDALLPPPRNISTSGSPSRMLDLDEPLSRSPEPYDSGYPSRPPLSPRAQQSLRAQQRFRTNLLHQRRYAEGLSDAANSPNYENVPSSVMLRRMAMHYERFLDDTIPHPTPEQEEDMRSRARAALNLLQESEEGGRGPSSSTETAEERDSTVDRLPGRSSPETSNLSSRSILHALMMRSMRFASEVNASGPTSTSTSVVAHDGSDAGQDTTSAAARSGRNWQQLPASEDVRDMVERGFNLEASERNRTLARPRIEVEYEPRGSTEQLSARASMSVEDNPYFCPPEMLASPPPPVSAGVYSQSSFASMSPTEERGRNRRGGGGGSWADWSDSSPPGLLSTSSSEDEGADGEESWGGSARSHSEPSSPMFTSTSTLDSDLPSELPITMSASATPRNLPSTLPSTVSETPSSPLATTSASAPVPTLESLPPCRELIERTDPLDVAGVCFDPSGAYMYVVTSDGITEWEVQGATNQRWWSSSGYI